MPGPSVAREGGVYRTLTLFRIWLALRMTRGPAGRDACASTTRDSVDRQLHGHVSPPRRPGIGSGCGRTRLRAP